MGKKVAVDKKKDFMVQSEKYPGIIQLLKDIHLVFKKHEIVYWLDCGTLLKSIRDSHLIGSDLDFSSWQTEIHKIISACEKLAKSGFKIKTSGNLPFIEDQLRLLIPDRYVVPYRHIDIYFHGILNNEAVRRNSHHPVTKFGSILFNLSGIFYRNEIYSEGFKKKLFKIIPGFFKTCLAKLFWGIYTRTCESMWNVIPLHYYENLREIKINDMGFLVPAESETYLEYRYGARWNIVDKTWRISDGSYIRFRRLNRFPKDRLIVHKINSDLFFVKKYHRSIKRQGNFDFTPEEVQRIRNLDGLT